MAKNCSDCNCTMEYKGMNRGGHPMVGHQASSHAVKNYRGGHPLMAVAWAIGWAANAVNKGSKVWRCPRCGKTDTEQVYIWD